MKENICNELEDHLIQIISERLNKLKMIATKDTKDAITILILVNKEIEKYMENMDGLIKFSDSLLEKIDKLKIPFVVEAKEEAVNKISKMIIEENNPINKINDYLSELKESGIDIDFNIPAEDNKCDKKVDEQRYNDSPLTRKSSIRTEENVLYPVGDTHFSLDNDSFFEHTLSTVGDAHFFLDNDSFFEHTLSRHDDDDIDSCGSSPRCY